MGMVFFIIAEIGYRAAQVFYDALLSDVSTPETIGSVSGKGWAIGMVGGIVALLIVLLPIQFIGNEIIHWSFLLTAAFYLLSSVPTFLWVEEKPSSAHINAGRKTIRLAFEKLAQTFRDVRNYKEFIKYMIAFLIYNDGIMMLMDFAAIIGATLFGMKQIQLIIFVIVIQIAGAFGALLFGRIADKKSSKDAILLSLIILIASVTGLFFIKEIFWFFVVGFLAGFSLSGAQTSRPWSVSLGQPQKPQSFTVFCRLREEHPPLLAHWFWNNHIVPITGMPAVVDMITSEQYGLWSSDPSLHSC